MIYNLQVSLPYESLVVYLSNFKPAISQHHYHQIPLHDMTTLSHGNSYIFYEVANSYEFVRLH